jgi:hypothetical protein
MKLVQQTAILISGLLFVSCMNANYQVNGTSGFKRSTELKSYAFAENPADEQSTEKGNIRLAVHKDLLSKNYFYDNVDPDVLVFIDEMPEGVKLLSGNTYKVNGAEKYETRKIKTRGKALFIQMVETQNYKTIWRGFAAQQSSNQLTMILQPRIAESVLNQ